MRTLLLPILVFVLLSLPLGCTDGVERGSAKACAPCTWDGDCADGFFCDKNDFVCKTPKMAKTPGPDCRDECTSCATNGACTPTATADGSQTGCAPSSDKECQQSTNCKLIGQCTRVQSQSGWYECRGVTTASCAASETCANHGRCDVSPSGDQCVPTTDSHCQQSVACSTKGDCTLWQAGASASCEPGSPEDCQAPAACDGLFGPCIYCSGEVGKSTPQCALQKVLEDAIQRGAIPESVKQRCVFQ